ncbi:MAG: 3-hydroxyacyl-ACP dehydratase FabZ [Oscillospiraceae bacterium]|nr:3-hydroxyacyl-ACP dehydratase FabZ [Oscillospiraceae bacterium]
MVMDLEQIKTVLPHREPFLFLDRVDEVIPGVRASATWHISDDLVFFQGHFPGLPVLPGALIIEAMAQTGAVSLLSMPDNKGKVGFMTGVDKAKFRKKVLPGDTLTLKSELIKNKMGIGFADCTAHVGDELAASATISFYVG